MQAGSINAELTTNWNELDERMVKMKLLCITLHLINIMPLSKCPECNKEMRYQIFLM